VSGSFNDWAEGVGASPSKKTLPTFMKDNPTLADEARAAAASGFGTKLICDWLAEEHGFQCGQSAMRRWLLGDTGSA
jgi:hypothetical protein